MPSPTPITVPAGPMVGITELATMYSPGVDGVRQRRREGRQQEAVQAHGEQHAAVEDQLRPARTESGGHHGGEAQRQTGPAQIEDDQDLPARPAVQDHADERAQDRERQQGDGQHGGHRGGVGLALRGEQHVRGQRHLQHAVGGLGRHPDGEQPPEQPVPPQLAQTAYELHGDEYAAISGSRTLRASTRSSSLARRRKACLLARSADRAGAALTYCLAGAWRDAE